MLQAARKLAKTKIFKLVIYVLIAAFALTGVSAGFLADFTDNYIVKVADDKIYGQQVQERFKRITNNLAARGIDFSEEQLASMGISRAQVLQNMVEEKLLHEEIENLGLQIGDGFIKEQIKTSPLFQEDGKFSSEAFNRELYQRGVREANYIETLRKENAVNMLMSVILNDNVTNEIIKQNMLDNYSQARHIRLVKIPAGKKNFAGKISDEDLNNFYFENSFMFEVEEKRSASYITIEGKAGAEAATYELIANVEDELAGGETLQEIAEKQKLPLKKVEQITEESEEVSSTLLENIFALEEGEPSNVIEDGNNYYVIQINEIKESYIPELAEVKSEASKLFRVEKNREANREFASEIYNQIKEKNDYRATARNNNLKTVKLDAVKKDDFTAANYELVQSSFAAKEGEVFGVFDNIEGGYDVAILEEISKEELSEVDVAKYNDQVTKNLEAEIISQYLNYLQGKYGVEENPNFIAN